MEEGVAGVPSRIRGLTAAVSAALDEADLPHGKGRPVRFALMEGLKNPASTSLLPARDTDAYAEVDGAHISVLSVKCKLLATVQLIESLLCLSRPIKKTCLVQEMNLDSQATTASQGVTSGPRDTAAGTLSMPPVDRYPGQCFVRSCVTADHVYL